MDGSKPNQPYSDSIVVKFAMIALQLLQKPPVVSLQKQKQGSELVILAIKSRKNGNALKKILRGRSVPVLWHD